MTDEELRQVALQQLRQDLGPNGTPTSSSREAAAHWAMIAEALRHTGPR
jgi:hypothetical protein